MHGGDPDREETLKQLSHVIGSVDHGFEGRVPIVLALDDRALVGEIGMVDERLLRLAALMSEDLAPRGLADLQLSPKGAATLD